MNKQVAGELRLSEITVKIHRGSVMRKMGVRSLADLVKNVELLKAAEARLESETPSALRHGVKKVFEADLGAGASTYVWFPAPRLCARVCSSAGVSAALNAARIAVVNDPIISIIDDDEATRSAVSALMRASGYNAVAL